MTRRSRETTNERSGNLADEEHDSVICRLCRRPFRTIAWAHLYYVHGQVGEHPVRDYKKRFNVPSAACPDLRERLTEARIEFYEKRGQHLTPRRILSEIRKRGVRGHSLRYTVVPSLLCQSARRHFGSWQAAVEAAGFDYEKTTGWRRWTRERVLAEIQKLAKVGAPLHMRFINRRDAGLSMAARRFFPQGWSTALKAAGVDPKQHNRKYRSGWDAARATAWIKRRLADKCTIRASDAPADLYRFVYRRLNKTWSQFIKQFGISYPRGMPQWSRERVVDEIRRRHAKGKKLNFRSTSGTQQNLARHARSEFGSWDASLRAAGFNPEEHRLVSPSRWNAAKAGAWLRKRVRTKSSILWRAVPRDLREFVQRRLGIGWIAFVESCGITYPRAKPRFD